MRRFVPLLAGWCLIPGFAVAGDAPALWPTRDVTVVYAMGTGDTATHQTVRWQAATARQRVDAPDGKAFMIADLKAKQLDTVSTATHELHRGAMQASPMTGGKADFEKLAAASFAGQACTYWSVTPAPGTAGRKDDVCLTMDGVMLAIRMGTVVVAQATSITYAPLDPSLFILPTGYKEAP